MLNGNEIPLIGVRRPATRTRGGVQAPSRVRPPLRLALAPTPAAVNERISTRRWKVALMVADVLAALAAVTLAMVFRFGQTPSLSSPADPYLKLTLALPALWLAMLCLAGVYDVRRLGTGLAEFSRITTAGLWALAVLVFGSYITHANLSREVVALTLPAMTGLTLGSHLVGRQLLHRRIGVGASLHRVVAAGSVDEVRGLVDHIARLPRSGLQVIGVCVPDGRYGDEAEGSPPVLGSLRDLLDAVTATGADTIAIAGSSVISGARLRRLSWNLEGTGVRLMICPGFIELAGPRLLVRPVGGLPLLHVREAEFSGVPRAAKAVMDRACAALLLVALSPIIAGIALAVAISSPGPVLFRQVRVGLHGQLFNVLKFRTMYDGADRDRHRLDHLNENDGVLFKIREDPRVTPVGRILRRFSIDELPQLWNVLTGSMSLVGPRPPLASEVEQYPSDLRRRRLLVKPGITGLWQVSGRSDLPWDETVRLDLDYVENWSVALDAIVMLKTLRAVVSGRGAY